MVMCFLILTNIFYHNITIKHENIKESIERNKLRFQNI
jgi:hypothetical protein